MSSFSHVDAQGNPLMVDVSEKNVTRRTAVARAVVQLDAAILSLLEKDEIHTKKGPVFHTAILAGVMGAKKTSDLIPLCHPLALEKCKVTIRLNENKEVVIDCEIGITAKTGVEMEALTGATVAALTIYDMCKGISHNIVIREIKLISKSGGKHDFERS